MPPKRLKEFFSNDLVIGLLLLIVFLLTNGYIYGWDDQHLEIPHLKSLIDSSLYPGDYYVQTLKKNFPSYFYHLLARVITIDQIPAVYFILYLFSRYFMFFWMYKLWHFISKDKFSAVVCVLSSILVLRVDEFLYRSFSHQEFSLGIVMMGIYFFYKERFILSALILGLVANFHAIYPLFIMIYMGAYLLLNVKKYGPGKFIKTCLMFGLAAFPFIYGIIKKNIENLIPPDSGLLDHWMDLYYIACPQNFIFQEIRIENLFTDLNATFKITSKYFILIGLYLLNFLFSEDFRKDKKIHIISGCAVLLLMVSFVFNYITPDLFMIDLNLIRNIQYLQFFLFGYVTLLAINESRRGNPAVVFLVVMMFALLRFKDAITLHAIVFLIFLFWIRSLWPPARTAKKILFSLSAVILSLLTIDIIHLFRKSTFSHDTKLTIYAAIILLILTLAVQFFFKGIRHSAGLRNVCILIPLLTVFIQYIQFHREYLEITKNGPGLWQLQRNWIDMQKYVKANTPKDALLLVPYDTEMGGFRIHGERTIVCDYRDVGLIGFDYRAAVEWQKRKKDIEPFKVLTNENIEPALQKAILKYKVNYIVFMSYMKPPMNVPVFEKMYENEVFALYKVRSNPVPVKNTHKI